MQNISPLTRVRAVLQHNGEYRYIGYFADGTVRQIRRSGRVYVSVAQVRTYRDSDQSDFLFSSKPSPALRTFEQRRHIVTVPIGLETEVRS